MHLLAEQFVSYWLLLLFSERGSQDLSNITILTSQLATLFFFYIHIYSLWFNKLKEKKSRHWIQWMKTYSHGVLFGRKSTRSLLRLDDAGTLLRGPLLRCVRQVDGDVNPHARRGRRNRNLRRPGEDLVRDIHRRRVRVNQNLNNTHTKK